MIEVEPLRVTSNMASLKASSDSVVPPGPVSSIHSFSAFEVASSSSHLAIIAR